MKAATYTRVSTGRQVEEGASLEAQQRTTRAYAEANGWQVVGEYTDAGISGRDLEHRTGMQEAVSRAGSFDRLIVWKMSRFGRSARDVLNLVHTFQQSGTEVVFVEDGIDTSKAQSRFLMQILAAVAEMESANISVQVRAGMEQRASDGVWQGGPTPFGLTTDETGRLTIDEPAAATLRQMASLIIDGKTTGQVARWLNARIKTYPPPRAATWKSGEVRRHLSSRHLIGELDWDGIPVPAPAVLDQDVWHAVMPLLENTQRPHQGRRTYPMSQRVVCTCGDIFISAGLRNGVNYYRCRSWVKPYRCDFTGQHWHRADALEDHLWQLLVDEAEIGFISLPPRDQPNTDEVDSLRTQVRKLTDAYAQALVDSYIDKAHRKAAGTLKSRLDNAEAELSRAQTDAARFTEVHEAVSDADSLAAVTDLEERLEWIRRLNVGWHVIPEEYSPKERPRFEMAWFE